MHETRVRFPDWSNLFAPNDRGLKIFSPCRLRTRGHGLRSPEVQTERRRHLPATSGVSMGGMVCRADHITTSPHHHIIHNCVTISAKSCLPSLLCPTLSTTKPAGCLGSASMHTQFWTAEVAHVRTAFLWSVEEQSLAGALEITDRDRRQHDQRRYQHGGSQGNGRWTMRRRERYRWLGVETKQTKQTTAIGTIINHHRRSVTHT